MPAFSERRSAIILTSIQTLWSRQLQFKKNSVTPEDLIELFVQPEHRAMVTDVVDICRVSGHVDMWPRIQLPGGLQVRPNIVYRPQPGGHPGFVAPTYVGGMVVGSAQPYTALAGEAGERLLEWINWRLKMGRDWGLARAVFENLNRICESPAQLRFFWPSVVPLLAMDESTKDAADKLSLYKTPSNIPKLHPELQQACISTRGVISKALLLPDPEKVKPEPSLVMLNLSVPNFPAPWNERLTVQAF